MPDDNTPPQQNATDQPEYPKFISIAPAGKDYFYGKPQERLAEDIANGISSSPTVYTSPIIGLEGKWGSGKSNVIKLLESKLNGEEASNEKQDSKGKKKPKEKQKLARKKEQEYRAYIYDAWGHQEDLRRKSFIEWLSGKIKPLIVGKSARGKLKEKTENILAVKRKYSTTTTPHINPGLFIIAALLFIPSYMVMADIFRLCMSWKIIIAGIQFALLILLAILGCKYEKIRSLIFSVYTKEALKKTTHEIISERDTTLEEFRDWCAWIDKNIDNTKLIIVFDNIDRLPAEKIATLWSSINTFLPIPIRTIKIFGLLFHLKDAICDRYLHT